MSIETIGWAKRQRTGNPATRAVLVELANWANPTGLVEFRRISDIADACEMSERTAQRHINRLELPVDQGGLGLIERVNKYSDRGAQKANGFRLVGYARGGDNLTRQGGDNSSPPRVTDRHRGGDTGVTPGGDNGVTPINELDLELDSLSPARERSGRASAPIPVDWVLPAEEDLSEPIAVLARQWPPGAYRSEGEAFRLHWRGRGARRADWTALWAARVQERHETVMRQAKAGIVFGACSAGAPVETRPAVAAKRREDVRSADLHEALIERLGTAVWEQWFQPAALVFDDCGLVVVAPSAFHRSQLENQHGRDVDAALSALGIGMDWVKFVTDTENGTKKRGDTRRG
jgi:hypothetical protein